MRLAATLSVFLAFDSISHTEMVPVVVFVCAPIVRAPWVRPPVLAPPVYVKPRRNTWSTPLEPPRTPYEASRPVERRLRAHRAARRGARKTVCQRVAVSLRRRRLLCDLKQRVEHA